MLYPFADKFSKGEGEKIPQIQKNILYRCTGFMTFMGFQMEEPGN